MLARERGGHTGRELAALTAVYITISRCATAENPCNTPS